MILGLNLIRGMGIRSVHKVLFLFLKTHDNQTEMLQTAEGKEKITKPLNLRNNFENSAIFFCFGHHVNTFLREEDESVYIVHI